jgi:uncharacterized phage protein gp47/JayE
MPFSRTPRADLLRRVQGDFNAALPGTDASLRRSAVGGLSFMHGMAMDSQYAYLDWLSRQIIPPTADAEMLLRWAQLFLPVPWRDATFASGLVNVGGVAGAVLPAGSLLSRKDGAQFSTDSEVDFAGSSATVSCTALVAGLAGNCAGGTALALASPELGVLSSATVATSGIVGGDDLESLESVLARLQHRIQTPPQGGSGDDYVGWIYDAHPGVTRAWAFPLENGPGTITLRFACDDAYAGGIPLPGDVVIVDQYVATRRPVTAKIVTAAPVASPINFTISGLDPDLQSVRDDIAARLADLIRVEGTPGGECWMGYTTATGGKILWSHIVEAIGAAAGINDFVLASPSANVTADIGYMPTLGVISWT